MLQTSRQPTTTAARRRRLRIRQIFSDASALLTARRVTVHAALLGICLWSAYAINLATPGLRDRVGHIKGGDFIHFYSAANMLRAHHASQLYDAAAQAAFQRKLLPKSGDTYFVPMYGPQVYLLFVPLAGLPYGWAALIWVLLNAVVYFACCYAVWCHCPHLNSHRSLLWLLAAAFPAFFSLIAFGQSSAPALVLFTLAFFALQAHRPFLAGLALGSLVYKPQLALAAAVICLFAGEWKILAGGFTAAVAQLGFAWAWFGAEVMQRYVRTFAQLSSAQPFLEPKLYQMHSLRSFWLLALPWKHFALALYLVSAAVIVGLAVAYWRRADALRLRYAMLLIASVLVAPHLWIYDLVILAPALLLLGDWMQEHPEARTTPALRLLLYGCYALPLLGPLAKFTRIQLSVLAFAALFWLLQAVAEEQTRGLHGAQL